jgi:hypothetical protein
MVGFKLLVQETKARKMTVPDAELEAQISQMRQRFPSESFLERWPTRKSRSTS